MVDQNHARALHSELLAESDKKWSDPKVAWAEIPGIEKETVIQKLYDLTLDIFKIHISPALIRGGLEHRLHHTRDSWRKIFTDGWKARAQNRIHPAANPVTLRIESPLSRDEEGHAHSH